jgi:predicted Zn-dependent protease
MVVAPWLFSRPVAAAPALPSPAQQKAVGAKTTEDLLKKYPQVKDGRLRFFERVAKRLVAHLSEPDRTTWDYQYYVLDGKEVNAFAVPGGPIFMLTGLLAIMKTEDAVAAVTGHELAHVYLQHWAKAYVKQLQRRRVVAIGTLLAGNKAAALGWGAVIAGVLRHKYSRDDEDAADAAGLKDMVAAGYNPEGTLQLFQTLMQAGGNGGGPLGGPFLADHPLTSDRIARTKQRIAQMGPRSYPPLKPFNYDTLR